MRSTPYRSSVYHRAYRQPCSVCTYRQFRVTIPAHLWIVGGNMSIWRNVLHVLPCVGMGRTCKLVSWLTGSNPKPCCKATHVYYCFVLQILVPCVYVSFFLKPSVCCCWIWDQTKATHKVAFKKSVALQIGDNSLCAHPHVWHLSHYTSVALVQILDNLALN